ncbi:MAG: hypothetical protein U9P37_08590, partial [Pseudomonadota bacterium]|nr:hypothetical protein [Pseudomonadota bacterium]
KDFLDRFSSLLEETDTDCFAWALLGNHFHLLLCCQRIKLSTLRKVVSISKARALFCYIAVRLMGEKGFAVGNFLSIGPSGVSRAVTRGDQVLQDDQGLKMKLNELISQ